MNGDELAVVRAMASRGGGFVQALSKCFVLADRVNFKKLQHVFIDYWNHYADIAGKGHIVNLE